MKHLIVIFAICAFAACYREGGQVDTGSAEPSATTADTSVPSATTTAVSGGTVSAMSNEDKEFVIKAAQADLAEIAMGQIAAQRAASPDVKAFASRMVTDHTIAKDELTQLANIKGLALPSEPAQSQKSAAEHVSAMSGKAFDTMYMAHMVEDHDKAVADFDKAAQSAQDADVKAWAARTLPTLKDHQRLAKETSAKLR